MFQIGRGTPGLGNFRSLFLGPRLKKMVVVFPILLAVSVAMLVPLMVDKVWQYRKSERVVERVDQEIKLFYPGYTNANWEYVKIS